MYMSHVTFIIVKSTYKSKKRAKRTWGVANRGSIPSRETDWNRLEGGRTISEKKGKEQGWKCLLSEQICVLSEKPWNRHLIIEETNPE